MNSNKTCHVQKGSIVEVYGWLKTTAQEQTDTVAVPLLPCYIGFMIGSSNNDAFILQNFYVSPPAFPFLHHTGVAAEHRLIKIRRIMLHDKLLFVK